MAFDYQSFATLNVNLNRQSYGPLDISAVFKTKADLDFYLSKGRVVAKEENNSVDAYWYDHTNNKIKITPYPYEGQIIATIYDGVKVFALKEITEAAEGKVVGEFETVNVGDTSAVETAISELEQALADASLELSNSIETVSGRVDDLEDAVADLEDAFENRHDANTTYVFSNGEEVGTFKVTPYNNGNAGQVQKVEVGIKKVSDLSNDAKYQSDTDVATSIAEALTAYYTSAEVESIKTTLEGKISAIPKFRIQVIEALPETGEDAVVYLVPMTADADYLGGQDGNLYSEYIYVQNEWELLGRQKLDLSDYATDGDLVILDEELRKAIADAKTDLIDNHITPIDQDLGELEERVKDLEDADFAGQIEQACRDAVQASADAALVSHKVRDADTDFAINPDTGKLSLSEAVTAKLDKIVDSVEIGNMIDDAIGDEPTKNEETGEYSGATGIFEKVYTRDEIADLLNSELGGSAEAITATFNKFKNEEFAPLAARVKTIEDQDLDTRVKELEDADLDTRVTSVENKLNGTLILNGGNSETIW